jgi:catechol 2,3-dioxygenase
MSDAIQAETLAPHAVILARTPLRIAAMSLRVRDVERVGAFYREVVGLSELGREGNAVRLGAGGSTLVELRDDPSFKRREPRGAGLFHTAFLMPTRSDLAAWVRNAAEKRFPIAGASDHAVSEAFYLNDPEGNGVEIYADRPSAEWPHANGQIAMTTEALDVERLLAARAGRDWRGAPAGLVVGHMHLQVGALAAADGFYRDVLGFDIACRYPGASFYGAGGYHHQIAANIWSSRNAGTIDERAAGLAGFEIAAQDEAMIAAIAERAANAGLTGVEGEGGLVLRDPWGLPITLKTS